MTPSQMHVGFVYDITTKRKDTGAVVSFEHAKNRVPMEGLTDIMTAYFKGGAGPANLYIGLWSGTHIPTGDETAATLASVVTEFVDYSQANRLPLTLGSVINGSCTNAADLARFDMVANGTVNGAFISTVPTKGAATGKLLSIVRFDNPRIVDPTVYCEVLTGFQIISLA